MIEVYKAGRVTYLLATLLFPVKFEAEIRAMFAVVSFIVFMGFKTA